MIDNWSDGTVLANVEQSGYWSGWADTAWGTDTGYWREESSLAEDTLEKAESSEKRRTGPLANVLSRGQD